ncbi:hypothetical protein GCM10023328_13600 [Modestobacter marinus]|uniref:Uncharacterized protein n=1 Tax=Modestobacter marinus TaxID=477641 RepID=A0A846LN52_9ACTN|nr:hypothetical protein [Modestobacter marinus]NIH69006.1 hypothetical protein [Modestobacter marinus]GGL78256.1 hypothetical protein GCM10011589_37940 [Modestobacter marinus]
MRRTGSSRVAGEEGRFRLTVRAGIAVVDVAAACLPYAVEAAADAVRAAGRRLRGAAR